MIHAKCYKTISTFVKVMPSNTVASFFPGVDWNTTLLQ